MYIRYCTNGACIIDRDTLVSRIVHGSLLIYTSLLSEYKPLFVVSDTKRAHGLSVCKWSVCAHAVYLHTHSLYAHITHVAACFVL